MPATLVRHANVINNSSKSNICNSGNMNKSNINSNMWNLSNIYNNMWNESNIDSWNCNMTGVTLNRNIKNKSSSSNIRNKSNIATLETNATTLPTQDNTNGFIDNINKERAVQIKVTTATKEEENQQYL